VSKIDKLRVRDYLEHMTQAIKRIGNYTENMADWAFRENEMVQDAVIRNIEIIGEASRNIERHHAEFAAQHPEVRWAVIYAMRNRVSHGYFQIDLDVVWKTVQSDLPNLATQVRELLQQLGQDSP
jgi:uncharacterized protein with HEPN domain